MRARILANRAFGGRNLGGVLQPEVPRHCIRGGGGVDSARTSQQNDYALSAPHMVGHGHANECCTRLGHFLCFSEEAGWSTEWHVVPIY